MTKRVLMIAYHFPPLAGSSGIQRTLRFVQQLPEFGWEPAVLTASARAYERTSDDLVDEIPTGVPLRRAFALDAARHLSIAGRYPTALACPDRWMTWRFHAVRVGLAMIRELRPAVLWSTYPIATAHVIGRALHERSALPWIADFRDPMAQEGYPADPTVWKSFKEVEASAVEHARFSVFTTPGCARMYRERYPEARARIEVLENGFDEESFADVGTAAGAAPLNDGAITLLHSGTVYPSERDPTFLFEALARLSARGVIKPDTFRIRFRASAHDSVLQALAARHRVEPLIEFAPPVPYRAALEEMMRADALLVLQASNCNEQIPAKLYEYLRSGRPIVGLTDPRGDTAGALRSAGLDAIAPLDSPDEIAALIERLLPALRAREAPLPDSAHVSRASRRARARSLAALLDRARDERSEVT